MASFAARFAVLSLALASTVLGVAGSPAKSEQNFDCKSACTNDIAVIAHNSKLAARIAAHPKFIKRDQETEGICFIDPSNPYTECAQPVCKDETAPCEDNNVVCADICPGPETLLGDDDGEDDGNLLDKVWGFVTDAVDDMTAGIKKLLKKGEDFFVRTIDAVKGETAEIIDGIKEDIAVELDALDDKVKALLESSDLMSKVKAADLDKVPQTLLANLKTLKNVAVTELKKMTHRLRDFTTENLEAFLDKIEDGKFRKMIKAFGCVPGWSQKQLGVLIKKVGKVLGKISGWSKEDFIEMGTMLKGLSQGDMTELKPFVIASGTLLTSIVTLTPKNGAAKRVALVNRVIELVGSVRDWDPEIWKEIRDVWPAVVNSGDIAVIGKEVWDVVAMVSPDQIPTQVTALVDRFFELTGRGIKEMTAADWRELKSFVTGLAADKLRELSANGIKQLRTLTLCSGSAGARPRKACLSQEQVTAVIDAAKTTFGEASSWPSSETPFESLGMLLLQLREADITKLGKQGACKLVNTVAAVSDGEGQFLPRKAAEIAKQLGGNWMANSECDVTSLAAAVTQQDIASAGSGILKKLAELSGIVERFSAGELSAAALMQRAKAVYGDITSWDVTALEGIMKLVPVFSEADLSKFPAKLAEMVLTDPISDVLSEAQLTALADSAEKGGRAMGKGAPFVLKQKISQLDTIEKLVAWKDAFKGADGNLLQIARKQLVQKLIPSEGLDAGTVAKLDKLVTLLSVGDIEELKQEAIKEIASIEPGTCPSEVSCDTADPGWASAELGLDFCKKKVSALFRRAAHFVAANGQGWNVAKFKEYKTLLTGLTEGEIAELPEEAFEVISQITCWDKAQLKCLAERAIEVFRDGKGVESWTSADWDKLGSNVAAGFSSRMIADIPAERFDGRAARVLGAAVDKMDSEQVRALLNKAKESFGSAVSKWKKSEFAALPGVLVELTGGEIESIDACALKDAGSQLLLDTLCKESRLHLLAPEKIKALFSRSSALQLEDYCTGEGPLLADDQLVELCAKAAGRYAAVCKRVHGVVSRARLPDCAAVEAADRRPKTLERVIKLMLELPESIVEEQVAAEVQAQILQATSLESGDIGRVEINVVKLGARRRGRREPRNRRSTQEAEAVVALDGSVTGSMARDAVEATNEHIMNGEFVIKIPDWDYTVHRMARLDTNAEFGSSQAPPSPSGPAPTSASPTTAPDNDGAESAAAGPAAGVIRALTAFAAALLLAVM